MANDKSVGRESDKFMLRFPEGMRDQIAEAAKAAGRSMNSEIVARLEASFVASSIDRDVALAQGAAGAVLKGLERVNENVALFAKRMDRIEAHFSTVAGGAEPLSLGKPAMVMRKDGAVTPFEPPEERPTTAPPASKGPPPRRVVRRRS